MFNSKLILSLLGSTLLATQSLAALHTDQTNFLSDLKNRPCHELPQSLYLNHKTKQYDVGNAYTMLWLAQLPSWRNKAAEKQIKEWGFDSVHFIENGPRGIKVMLAETPDDIIVTFRHTNGLLNWLQNIKFNLVTFEDREFAMNSEIHQGFGQMINAIWDETLEYVSPKVLDEKKRLWVTGQSLGGALAPLLAAGFDYAGLPIHRVYLTGAPKTGSIEWAKTLNDSIGDRTFRAINKSDFISRMPHGPEEGEHIEKFYDNLWIPKNLVTSIENIRNNSRFGVVGQYIKITKESLENKGISESSTDDRLFWDNANTFFKEFGPGERLKSFMDSTNDHAARKGYSCTFESFMPQDLSEDTLEPK